MIEINIEDTLNKLGFSLRDKGSYWQTKAIWRGGDNDTAVQIYKDSGVWRDFVESPDPKPFVALIQKVLRTNDKKIIAKYINGAEIDYIIKGHKEKATIKTEKIFSENCLKKLTKDYSFYTEKNISPKTLEMYKCGIARSGKLYNRIVFPIYNEFLSIHGFTGRDLNWSKDSEYPKWKHFGETSNWVYPFYVDKKFRKSIEEKKEIILIESVGDSLALSQNGIFNHLVIFGGNLSPKIIASILQHDVERIIISTNNDSNKEKNRGYCFAVKSFIKLMNFFDIEKISIKLPFNGDFSDMQKKEEDIHSVFEQEFSINQMLKDAEKFKNQKILPQKSFDKLKQKLS